MHRLAFHQALIAAIVVLAAGACSAGGLATGTATVPPMTPRASVPPVLPSPSPAAASPAVVATPMASSTPGSVAFDSTAYGYHAVIPGDEVAGDPVLAAHPWDGRSQVNSDGPSTDHVRLSDSRLLFVYGAPTELSLADYAAAGQRLKASWHGCPELPERTLASTLDGSPALIHAFTCGGLRVLSLFTVRDGAGLVVNELVPPGSPAGEPEALQALLAGWTWLP